MPSASVDRDRLLALGSALAPWQECARGGVDEVLAHLVEVGDRDTQSALDDYLDLVADLLREIDASTSDLAARLHIATGRAEPPRHSVAPGPAGPDRLIDPRGSVR
jgi:hypothetical protein